MRCLTVIWLDHVNAALVLFLLLALAALAGLFLYGWRRRNEKPPPGVRPLTDEDDERWR
jgi:LPXTG-motif cell wall-anchored protein